MDTYNSQNRLTQTLQKNDGETTTTRYYYDNNGNMTSKQVEVVKKADKITTPHFGIIVIEDEQESVQQSDTMMANAFYSYDAFNRMIRSTANGQTASYAYNGEGYRTLKKVNGETTRYFYEADKVVLELDENGQETANNVYGLNLIQRTVGSETLYYLYNGHADVTALMSTNGLVVGTYYYDAFGNILSQTGSKDNPFRYAGYRYDEESGLYYLNARMYDPKIARFMQEDTYTGNSNDPLSLNLYTYCMNNPIIYWDPSGHYREGDEKYSASVQRQLFFLGEEWTLATTIEEKEIISRKADELRRQATENGWFLIVNSAQDAEEAKLAQQLTTAARTNVGKPEAYEAVAEYLIKKNSNDIASSDNKAVVSVEERQPMLVLNPGDILFLTEDNMWINMCTPEQRAVLLYKLKYNGTLSADDIIKLGIANEREYPWPLAWFNKMYDPYSSESIAASLELAYHINQNGCSLNEVEWQYKQQNQAQIKALMYHMAMQVATNPGGGGGGNILFNENCKLDMIEKNGYYYVYRSPGIEGTRSTQLTADDIKFSDKFSKPAYKNQITERGWTNRKIADTINNPVKTGMSVNKYTGNSVTVYYIDDVHYVAVDDVTGKVIQVADLNKADWVFDLTK